MAGGLESISLVQNELNEHHLEEEWLGCHKPGLYWPMLETAEYVAAKYGIGREAQDVFGVQSQQRAAQARRDGRFTDEIVPITTRMKVVDKETGEESIRESPRRKTRGSARTPRSKASRGSRRRSREERSPPATRASSPTAQPPASS